MLGPGGTGVSTYARALAEAQRSIDPRASVLEATGDRGRFGRWLRALVPLGITAHEEAQHSLVARDAFRLAQVYFDVHGRPLEVRPPFGGGLIHWTYPVPLRVTGWHNVYTVHDAIPLLQPSLTQIGRARFKRLLQSLLTTADHVVTVSDAARRDIIKALDLSTDRVTNCSQPVAMKCEPGIGPPFGLASRKYLLLVGSVEPRKNVEAVLNAYCRAGSRLPLVVAGPRAAGDGNRLEKLAAQTDGVVRLDYVDSSLLPALIAHARALLMPSLAEGFGLPVAEAMSLGTPVITSDGGALAETAGGAALLVNPLDIAAISAAIRAIECNEALALRLAAAGRRNAQRFTPDLFAARLGDLYAAISSERARN
jgi:glycosyltransferase involved in cell wall biosynthesis